MRNLTAIMRTIGYPHVVTMGNFKTPNFELVANMLFWMASRYCYDAENVMSATIIPTNIATQQQRVDFIIHTCKEISKQSSFTVNMDASKLYSADGHAVRELLKLAIVLFQARQISLIENDEDDVFVEQTVGSLTRNSTEQNSSTVAFVDEEEITSLSAEIIEAGTQLLNLLQSELENRPRRVEALKFLDAMSSNLELSTAEHEHVETSILRVIQTTKEDMEQLTRKFSDAVVEEKQLQETIRRRERDIERNQQRLDSLKTMRPSFLDEYQKLEEEYQKFYDIFVERYRNVDFLEHETAAIQDAAEKKSSTNQTLESLRKKYQDEELSLLRGQEDPLNRKIGEVIKSAKAVSSPDGELNDEQCMAERIKDTPDAPMPSTIQAPVYLRHGSSSKDIDESIIAYETETEDSMGVQSTGADENSSQFEAESTNSDDDF